MGIRIFNGTSMSGSGCGRDCAIHLWEGAPTSCAHLAIGLLAQRRIAESCSTMTCWVCSARCCQLRIVQAHTWLIMRKNVRIPTTVL